MINAVHMLLYSTDAEADRAFLRDVLDLSFVEDPPGEGWLIFRLPPAEMGVHPGSAEVTEMYLMCDDVEATVAELAARGVSVPPATDQGFGLLTRITLPSGAGIGLYEPRHATAYDL